MSAVSGVISRQILPVCDTLCFFCPGVRPRSRQPVKRYKKLIADIFPKSQGEEPNDRKIGKLCEYAAKNPLRIPKMSTSLEQRCYKELRRENYGSVKVVMCIYRKLCTSCKEQMPLFANSVMAIIETLLEQTQDEILIIGCLSLFDFVNNQKDATYMFNLEGFIPKICQMAQEVGDDDRTKQLRASGLRALSALVWFMGENSHIPVEFDNIVSVVLENYGSPMKGFHDSSQNKAEVHVSSSPDGLMKVPSWRMILDDKGQLIVAIEDSNNPCFWSRVSLHNMAKIGKEATTRRRVLESFFRYFDNENLWSTQDGIAFPVLKDMQFLMDDSGQNAHFLLSTLIKHLDRKNVVKQPAMQLDIVNVATCLTRLTKTEASVAIVSAISDVIRHLRRSIHLSFDNASLGEDNDYNSQFYAAVDECLTELSSKVGDAGLILDVMATMLENVPNIPVVARTTMSAVYRTAQIVASLPRLTYQKKAFPESLFHQLLPAMLHPDLETRIGAHQIFSVVLVPSSVSPCVESTLSGAKNAGVPRSLSRAVSVFSSSAALFEKLKSQRNGSTDLHELNNEKISGDGNSSGGVLHKIRSSYSRVPSFRSSPSSDADSLNKLNKDMEVVLRLSSHQISLLLSSIWTQSISPANMPQDYEAIAHTYSLVLLFSRGKNSYIDALIRSFQLAFSLRKISLGSGGMLRPARRRSLFLMSTSMIIFSARAYNILPLIPPVKATLSIKLVDPYLELVDDVKLRMIEDVWNNRVAYGCQEDDNSAQRCLSEIKISDDQATDSLASIIINNLGDLPTSEVSAVQEQLLKEFVPDDLSSITLGEERKMISKGKKSLEPASTFTMDDETLQDIVESGRHDPQLAIEYPNNLLTVDQLLQCVLETAHHVGVPPDTSTVPNASYNETAGHCEALTTGKKQRMSYLINNTHQSQGGNDLLTSHSYNPFEVDNKVYYSSPIPIHNKAGNPFLDDYTPQPLIGTCAVQIQQEQDLFRLPASSPFDNFLKAAGC